jgi:hypothetical protein
MNPPERMTVKMRISAKTSGRMRSDFLINLEIFMQRSSAPEEAHIDSMKQNGGSFEDIRYYN